MKQFRSFAALLSLTLALSACAALARQPVDTGPKTTLRVDNQAYLDMTIYVMRGAERVRLGIATGNAVTNFVIPANVIFGVSSLAFVADPIGGTRASISETINVTRGDEVMMTIPAG